MPDVRIARGTATCEAVTTDRATAPVNSSFDFNSSFDSHSKHMFATMYLDPIWIYISLFLAIVVGSLRVNDAVLAIRNGSAPPFVF